MAPLDLVLPPRKTQASALQGGGSTAQASSLPDDLEQIDGVSKQPNESFAQDFESLCIEIQVHVERVAFQVLCTGRIEVHLQDSWVERATTDAGVAGPTLVISFDVNAVQAQLYILFVWLKTELKEKVPLRVHLAIRHAHDEYSVGFAGVCVASGEPFSSH